MKSTGDVSVVSPLTLRSNVTLVKVIDAAQIIKSWRAEFDIDVRKDLAGNESIFLYRCDESGLLFFAPPGIEGSADLYEQLAKFDWYYMEDKLEHDWAERDLQRCHRVLEVGCGTGSFVKRLRERAIDAIGIELNDSACRIAGEQNLPVLKRDAKEMAPTHCLAFDGVCAFQVLEHVPEPLQFLKSIVTMLAPGGVLVISVPNAESFLKHSVDDLLDSPPHHQTRWNVDAFRFLQRVLPLKMEGVRFEGLAKYHIDWYLGIMASRCDPRFKRLVCNRFTKKMLELDLVRRCVRGHTLYVKFRKC